MWQDLHRLHLQSQRWSDITIETTGSSSWRSQGSGSVMILLLRKQRRWSIDFCNYLFLVFCILYLSRWILSWAGLEHSPGRSRCPMTMTMTRSRSTLKKNRLPSHHQASRRQRKWKPGVKEIQEKKDSDEKVLKKKKKNSLEEEIMTTEQSNYNIVPFQIFNKNT